MKIKTKKIFVTTIMVFSVITIAYAKMVLSPGLMNTISLTEDGGRFGKVEAGTTATGPTQINAATMVNDKLAKWRPGVNDHTNLCALGCCGNAGNIDRCIEYTLPPQFNVTDGASYKSNNDAQTYASTTDLQGRINFINQGGYDKYVGQNTPNGTPITEGSLLECMNIGVGHCSTYLKTGVDTSGGQISGAMAKANKYAAAGGEMPLSIPGAIAGNELTSITDSASGLYCDPAVLSMIQSQGAQAVDARMALATDARTGYSMLSGEGVLSAAGLGPNPSTTYIGGPTGSFRQMSCLDRLLSGGGINILFNPPSLSQILDMLLNAACQKASQLMANVTQPLSQSLYQNAGLDSFMPGWGLGSLGGGISTGFQQGQRGGINIGSTNMKGNSTNNIFNGQTGKLFDTTPDYGYTRFNGRLFQ